MNHPEQAAVLVKDAEDTGGLVVGGHEELVHLNVTALDGGNVRLAGTGNEVAGTIGGGVALQGDLVGQLLVGLPVVTELHVIGDDQHVAAGLVGGQALIGGGVITATLEDTEAVIDRVAVGVDGIVKIDLEDIGGGVVTLQ